MLSVNINQDVEQYQESVAFGLNAKQTTAALMALIVGIGITCLLYFAMGFSMEVSIYASLPFCIPIMLPALGKKYGLTVTEQIRQSNKKKRMIAYKVVSVQRGTIHTEQSANEKTSKGWKRKNWNGKEKKSQKK